MTAGVSLSVCLPACLSSRNVTNRFQWNRELHFGDVLDSKGIFDLSSSNDQWTEAHPTVISRPECKIDLVTCRDSGKKIRVKLGFFLHHKLFLSGWLMGSRTGLVLTGSTQALWPSISAWSTGHTWRGSGLVSKCSMLKAERPQSQKAHESLTNFYKHLKMQLCQHETALAAAVSMRIYVFRIYTYEGTWPSLLQLSNPAQRRICAIFLPFKCIDWNE